MLLRLETAHAMQASKMTAPPQVVDILLQIFDALCLLDSSATKAAAATAANSASAAPGRRRSRCGAAAAECHCSSVRRGLGTGCGAAAAGVASSDAAPGLEHLLLQLLLHLAQQKAKQL